MNAPGHTPADLRHIAWVMCATLRCRLRSLRAHAHPAPLIVLGNQKSGTTAIAALLARYAGLPVTLDMPAICWSIQGLLRAERPLETFARKYRSYFSAQIIKEPWLTFLAPQVAEVVPRATFLLVVRDPRDNIRSICDRLAVRGDHDDTPRAIHRLTRGWREIFLTESPADAAETHYIESLAQRWRQAARVPKELGAAKVTVIRYEDFLDDKAGCIARLARGLGRDQAEDIAHLVDLPFQPLGPNRNVDWQDFFGPRNLSRIERICADEMQALAYPPASRSGQCASS
jgi:hypothetical protein